MKNKLKAWCEMIKKSFDLFPFQSEVLNRVKDKNRVAFFLEMGLGKTFVGAEKMMQLGKRYNLVICQKSKLYDWLVHFFTNYDCYPYDLTKKSELNCFLKDNWWLDTQPKIGFINYELAWRRKELLNLEDFTLLLDESSLIQNRKAKQSKFVLRLNPTNVILLSGTPTSGKYENLWSQLHLLGWSISEDTYNSQYVNWKKQSIGWGLNSKIVKIVDKKQPYKNVDRLKDKMRQYGAVFMKSDEVLNLPEQIVTKIEVDVSKDYRSFCRKLIVEIDGKTLVGDTDLSKRLCLRQLCGQFSAEKLQAFKDLIQSTNDRMIVFYNFTDELNAMIHIIRELSKPFGVVNGEKKELDPYDNEDNSVTFVQYQAGAMGLNLQKANKIIYFTLPDGRQDLFDQSKKRIHRIGQKNTCFYYLLICRNSIEEEILETLHIRKEYTDKLFEEGE